MLDDGSLLRLAEMGVDVYAPRSAAAAERIPADSSAAVGPEASRVSKRALARVVLLARAEDPRAKGLLAQVVRTLAFARVDGVVESAVDEARIGDAAGLVVFGDAFVRQAGAVLSADRRKNLQWIATGDSAEIAASASAKRALWSELRRVLRALRVGR
jgi:hypothetical protein